MNPSGTEPLRPIDPVRIGPYQLLGRLGEGGMGTVYLALAPTERPVAIKVVKPEFTVDTNFAFRFHAEVENARKVASFCTAQVLDNGNTEDGRPYMVTEYIPGTPLSAQISRFGALDPGPLHGVALGVAAALAAIHVAGLVHRDLKPSNVILSMSGPRVIDFGISRALDAASGFTQSGELLGSPGWWAPEQVRGDAISPAVDVFAWGCLVAYAGNGRHPYGRGDALTLAARVLNTPPDLGALPVPLNDLARRATDPDPVRRPSAQELLLALVSGGVPSPVPVPAEPATLVATDFLSESWQPPANVADESAAAGEPAVLRITQALPATAPGSLPGFDTTDGRVVRDIPVDAATDPGVRTDDSGSRDAPVDLAADPGTAPHRTPAPQGPADAGRPAGPPDPNRTVPGAVAEPTAPGARGPAAYGPAPRGPVPYGPAPQGPVPHGQVSYGPPYPPGGAGPATRTGFGQEQAADPATAIDPAGALLDQPASPQKTDWRLVRKWLIPTLAVVAAIAVTITVLALVRPAARQNIQAGDNRFAGEQKVADGPNTDIGRRVALGNTDVQLLVPQPPRCEATQCVVRWTLVNLGGVDVPIGGTPKLVDGQGGGHTLKEGSTPLPKTLAPGAKVDGVLKFDVPPGRSPVRLVMPGGVEVRL